MYNLNFFICEPLPLLEISKYALNNSAFVSIYPVYFITPIPKILVYSNLITKLNIL